MTDYETDPFAGLPNPDNAPVLNPHPRILNALLDAEPDDGIDAHMIAAMTERGILPRTDPPPSPAPADDGQWALVEMMGHRQVFGRISERQLAGAGFIFVEIPNADGTVKHTTYVAPSSIYALTPMPRDEVLARLAPRSELNPWRSRDEDDYDDDDMRDSAWGR